MKFLNELKKIIIGLAIALVATGALVTLSMTAILS